MAASNPKAIKRLSNEPQRYIVYQYSETERTRVLDTTDPDKFEAEYTSRGIPNGGWTLRRCGETIAVGYEEWVSPGGHRVRFEWVFALDGKPVEKPENAQGGGVYLVWEVGSNFYKIGFSENPEKRIKSFTTIVMPHEYRLICVVRTHRYKELERELHDRFSHRRVNGEWFRLDDVDVEYIKRLAERAS